MDGMYSIKEAVDNYVTVSVKKTETPAWIIFGKAILSGMMIGFGAAAGNVAAHAVSNVGVARMLAGVVFPVGLMMIVLLGGELFTGDCLMIMSVPDNKKKWYKVLWVWILVWLGNLVGGVLLSWLIYKTGQFGYSSNLLGAYTIKVGLGKCNMTFGAAFISGILCNFLVCAAVMIANCAKDVSGKLLGCFFVIFLFVVSGYEHCVANMYYIAAGIFAKLDPAYTDAANSAYGLTKDALANLDVYHFLVSNLIPVTLGNIVGGAVVLGLPLYFFNRTKKNK